MLPLTQGVNTTVKVLKHCRKCVCAALAGLAVRGSVLQEELQEEESWCFVQLGSNKEHSRCRCEVLH